MLRSLNTTLRNDPSARAIFISLAVMMVIGCSLTLGLWRYQTFDNAAAIAALQIKLDAEIDRRKIMETANRGELDGIQRTLYTAPDPKVALRKPSAVENWQINRDNELRGTIARMERVISNQQSVALALAQAVEKATAIAERAAAERKIP